MLLSKMFKGAPDIDIKQFSVDSRVKMRDAIFFCMDGIKYDGHDYIQEAIRNGAKVVVYSEDIAFKSDKALLIQVSDVREVLIRTAEIFYESPNRGIDSYVICGNYGRSSVASFINYYLNQVSSCAYVGILGIRYKGFYLQSNFPTLNLLDNLKVLDALHKNDIHSCTFEASASALNLHKLDSIDADTMIYTCTDPDSSEFKTNDYYKNLRNYLYSLEKHTKVVLNVDDAAYNQINDCIGAYVSYGTAAIADYQINDISLSKKGAAFNLRHRDQIYKVTSSLQGIVNVYNLTAAIVALHINGHKLEDIIAVLKAVPCVEGVMERVDDEYDIIVDCAYDLKTIEEACRYAHLASNRHRAIGVISINYTDGDKRLEKIMDICDRYLDITILTENESLQGEVTKILERCDRYAGSGRIVHSALRSLAIENAIEIMNRNDIVLILGKGNEKFLSMGLGKERYNGDAYYARKFLNRRRAEEQSNE